MRRKGKRKISKFGSLLSLITLASMFLLFCVCIPNFMVSTAGLIFVGLWAFLASLSFVAHGNSLKARDERQYIPLYGIKKNGRTPIKKVHPTGSMRGLS